MVPLSIYPLHQLTDLHLRDCGIDHQPPVDGFGRLTTLCLEEVRIVYAETLLHLLSKSPLLRRVTLLYDLHDEDYIPFLELFKNLRLIEHLTTSVALFNMCLIKNAVPEKLPTSLVHLRYVHLKDTSFTNNNGLSCLAFLIKSSPNLEKIYLENERIYRREWYTEKDPETDPITLEDYSNMWLEHLYELKIQYFANLKTGLEFVKLILAKSPVLKKARIVLFDWVTKDEEIQLLRTLLRSPSVSPVVEIIVERPSR